MDARVARDVGILHGQRESGAISVRILFDGTCHEPLPAYLPGKHALKAVLHLPRGGVAMSASIAIAKTHSHGRFVAR